jgi:hypothetical protein
VSVNLDRINRTRWLAREVIDLLDAVEHEIYAQHKEMDARLAQAGVELSPLNAPAPSPSLITGTRTSGELRRRSLDLTRALSDLRRP